jgi:hypothetical protein
VLAAVGLRSVMLALPFAAVALLMITVARVRGAEGGALAARVLVGLLVGAGVVAAAFAWWPRGPGRAGG